MFRRRVSSHRLPKKGFCGESVFIFAQRLALAQWLPADVARAGVRRLLSAVDLTVSAGGAISRGRTVAACLKRRGAFFASFGLPAALRENS